MSDLRAEEVLRSARTIAGALLAGVLLYAGAVVYVVDREVALDPGYADTLFLAWIAVVAVCVAAWWAFRRKAIGLTRSSAGLRRIHQGEVEPERLLRHLVVAWAFLEAAAILGVTYYMFTGRTAALAGGVAIMVVGTAASFPRREWFAPFLRTDPGGAGRTEEGRE